MIESVCSNCGNKKKFSEDKVGKKYKCPNCGNIVSIENTANEQIVNKNDGIHIVGEKNHILKPDAPASSSGIGKIFKKNKAVLILFSILFIGGVALWTIIGNNPEKDGIKAAKEYLSSKVADNDLKISFYNDFLKKFDGKNYKKKIDAMNDFENALKQNNIDTMLYMNEHLNSEDRLSSKYHLADLGKFHVAYDSTKAAGLNNIYASSKALYQQILQKIADIKDPEPNVGISKSYSGNVGNLQTNYTLTWNMDGTISGTYNYSTRPNTAYTIKGKDIGNGNIQLAEYTGDKLTANCFLSHRGSCYEGQMNNTDGRQLNMTICQNNSLAGNLNRYDYTGIVISVEEQGNRGMTYLSIKTVDGKDESFLINGAKLYKDDKEVNFSLLIKGINVGVIGGDEAKRIDILDNTSNTNSKFQGKYPQASERSISQSEFNGMNKADMKIMRNEIFARHGYIFKTEDMKSYFSQQSWYRGQYENVTSMLSNIEKQNVELIKKFEN